MAKKHLYFDCFSGISGDMTIGALLDLGVDQNEFLVRLNTLNLDGYRLEIAKKQSRGITGTDFNVILEETGHTHQHAHHHPHRNLSDITRVIESSEVSDKTKSLSLEIFQLIAEAEAKVHGKRLDQVCFHEVGAIDSIVDIVGTAICVDLLEIDTITSSPLQLGSGTVECAHGVIPVPAPATLEILKDVPVYSTGVKGELVTPTGAAIIKCLADEFSHLPPMIFQEVGYGTGKKKHGTTANVLRALLGEREASDVRMEKLVLLETNIDDMSPEIYSYLLPLLLERGALDVYLTNIIMKKGRPGVLLSVLCAPVTERKLKETLFAESTTLGIRRREIDREYLRRKTVTIETTFGEISFKLTFQDTDSPKAAPEYEDCKRIALETNRPIREIYRVLSTDIQKWISRQ